MTSAIVTRDLPTPLIVRILGPIILMLVLGLDALVLHIRFWILNRNTVLKISDECIEININGSITEIIPDGIECLELNLTQPFFDHGPVWGPGEDYLYAFIRLKTGEEFIITSLLLAKLKFPEAMLNRSTKIQCFRA